jgi:hypothetical protein
VTGHRDMTAPNWARTVKAARRKAEELKALDFEIREPDNFDTPPVQRIAPEPDHQL